METVNHTPFPAAAFKAVDQHDQEFHVFVLRQTLSFSSGKLEYADKQAPLCEGDVHYGVDATSSVRQESDFCPYKPKCDVIVNATAYAPGGHPTRQFHVRLRVSAAGKHLVDKTLNVFGERHFKRKFWFVRLIQWAVKWGTLSLLRPSPWRLTRPKTLVSLPLRHERAYGGQCRINAGDPHARYLWKKERLSPEAMKTHPDRNAESAQQPVAHCIYEANPAGLGYAPAWFIGATMAKMVAAPQIEPFNAGLTEKQFWRLRKSNPLPADPAGFGIRLKSHPLRRAMLGKADDAFTQSDALIPKDFDFGIWNAAPRDQQIDFPEGEETYELANLCPATAAGAVVDKHGHSYLSLVRPAHACYILVKRADGAIAVQPLLVDTVLIEPDEHAFTLVWRLAIAAGGDAPIAGCEFRMWSFSERDRLKHDLQARRKKYGQPLFEVVSGVSA